MRYGRGFIDLNNLKVVLAEILIKIALAPAPVPLSLET